MVLSQGNRRWPAGVVLLLLAAVFIWIGRRPGPVGDPVTPEPPLPAVVEALLETTDPPAVPEPEVRVAESEAAPEPEPEVAPPAEVPVPELRFGFPTDNKYLLESQPEKFFMFVDRYTTDGQVQVWQGGDYGFVRNPRQTVHGTVYTKFHEGIDIAPAVRDPKGEPQDEIRAVADGTVAYVTASPRSSNYGHYIVVLHPMGEAGVFYSLYAHLRSIDIAAGTPVKLGQKLGMLGYTGAGINLRRAHVHLEMGLILSERFETYYSQKTGLANGHGNFHGSNLIGMNAGAFLAAHAADPHLMPQTFLQSQEVYYKVVVPNRGDELELVKRHPWLRRPGPAAASWEIAFTGPGVPVAVAPSAQTATFASVSWVKPYPGYHSWNTRSLLGGSGNTATLTAEGSRFMTLVAGDF